MSSKTVTVSSNCAPRPAVAIPRANILGVGISAINMSLAVDRTRAAIADRRKGYICVTGVHGIMEAQTDDDFMRIQNASLLTTPDGMPTVWLGRLQGHRHMRRVYGPEFMLAICELSQQHGYRHFFYGGKPGVAEELKRALTRRFPELMVVGTYTPPFRALNPDEREELRKLVAESRPDFLWVGLSTPKQERFMAEYIDTLDVNIMVGVGAAFDILTGAVRDAPQWVKAAGLQWAHRLVQEPSRLWKRYVFNNSKFIVAVALQLCGVTKHRDVLHT